MEFVNDRDVNDLQNYLVVVRDNVSILYNFLQKIVVDAFCCSIHLTLKDILLCSYRQLSILTIFCSN